MDPIKKLARSPRRVVFSASSVGAAAGEDPKLRCSQIIGLRSK